MVVAVVVATEMEETEECHRPQFPDPRRTSLSPTTARASLFL